MTVTKISQTRKKGLVVLTSGSLCVVGVREHQLPSPERARWAFFELVHMTQSFDTTQPLMHVPPGVAIFDARDSICVAVLHIQCRRPPKEDFLTS